jgi:hypothetical protein
MDWKKRKHTLLLRWEGDALLLGRREGNRERTRDGETEIERAQKSL